MCCKYLRTYVCVNWIDWLRILLYIKNVLENTLRKVTPFPDCGDIIIPDSKIINKDVDSLQNDKNNIISLV